jgi:Ca-activated chloride channel family protein
MTQFPGDSCRTVVLNHAMHAKSPGFPPRSAAAALARGAVWLAAACWTLLAAAPASLTAAPAAPVAVTAGAVSLEAEFDSQFYREGAESEIYVQARFRTSPLPVASDAPAGGAEPAASVRNVAFVLDRSGSMDGERLTALQAAVAGALDTLADRDVVSVVLFGSEVETLVEAQRCDQARERFARLGPIEAAGGAALYDGLSQGAAQVRRFAGPATVDQLILVTDGPATKGPRERADFVGLVETFVREGTAVSTIGLGDEFDEDLLATLARVGGGRFAYADAPARLPDALLREIAPSRAIVAIDALLTIEFRGNCDEVRAHGPRRATVEKNTVSVAFAHLAAGQELSVLASGTIGSFSASGIQRDLVRVRLRWKDPATGEARELVQGVTARFSPESRDVTEGYNIRVYRAAVASMISEGMQDAIEQLDRGDYRRALRELRRARDRARDINQTPEDAEIATMIRQLDAYIAEVQARGMNLLDRKVLRSGLFNQFESPSTGDGAGE